MTGTWDENFCKTSTVEFKAWEFVVVWVDWRHGQSAFINDDADKTDCIRNRWKFQCTDDIIAVLDAAFKNGESVSPNIKHFTIEFDVDIVNNDAHYVISLALQSLHDENVITSSFECIQTLYLF